jgi:hypothetical protein
MPDATVSAEPVQYRLDPAAGAEGEPAGSTSRAGLAAFLEFVRQVGLERVLRERVRLPVQERRTGFTGVQKRLALLAALASGCRSARYSDFVLKPDPAAVAALELPRWPHSSQLTRQLRAFGGQHVAALRQAFEDLLTEHSTARRRRAGRAGGDRPGPDRSVSQSVCQRASSGRPKASSFCWCQPRILTLARSRRPRLAAPSSPR